MSTDNPTPEEADAAERSAEARRTDAEAARDLKEQIKAALDLNKDDLETLEAKLAKVKEIEGVTQSAMATRIRLKEQKRLEFEIDEATLKNLEE